MKIEFSYFDSKLFLMSNNWLIKPNLGKIIQIYVISTPNSGFGQIWHNCKSSQKIESHNFISKTRGVLFFPLHIGHRTTRNDLM